MSANAALNLLQGDPADWGVPLAGRTLCGVNQSGNFCVKQSDGSVVVFSQGISPGLHKQTSATGTVDVTIGSLIWTEVVTLTGVQRTIPVVVASTNIGDGARLFLKLSFAALPAGSIIQIYSGVTLLAQFTADGLVLNGSVELYGDTGAWIVDKVSFPA